MQPSRLTRLRWRLEELRHVDDGKIIAGLLVIAVLAFGGFFAARTLARASPDSRSAMRIVTVRQKVRVREHGRVVTRWRVRRLYAQPRTVMSTQTLSTPNFVRLVTRPTTRSRVVYRNRLITGPVKTVTERATVVETTTAVSTQTVTVPTTVTETVPIP